VLLLLVLLFWVLSTLLLSAATLFLQGYFNETPPALPDVIRRGLIAGTVSTAFVGLWTFLAYRSPERFAPLTEFAASDELPYAQYLWTLEGKTYTEYRLDTQSRRRYLDTVHGNPLPNRPAEIVLMEGKERVHFKQVGEEPGRGMRYEDDRGRYMLEGYLGQPLISRPGRTVVYVFLNVVHGAIWLACFWPILRFSLGQAIVLSVGTWVAMTLFFLPPLLSYAGKPAAQKAAQKTGEGNDLVGHSPRPGQPCGPRRAYLEATAAPVRSTLDSSPARTLTRSVRVWAWPSTANSAFSV
jgi:hypothetical protein